MFRLGDWSVDPATRQLSRGTDVVRLAPKAMQVLCALHDVGGGVLSRADLLEAVWPDVTVGEEVLTHAITEIRRALGDDRRQPRYIETVHKTGYRLLSGGGAPAPSGNASAADTLLMPAFADLRFDPPEDRISLVIVPFRIQSKASGHVYLRDGIVDDVTSALARVKSFFVIARGTALAFADRDTDVREIAATLGVRYAVQGTLRVSGETLRISVHLTDAVRREEIWSAPFDGEFGESFEVQDRITEAIVGVLQPAILEAEIRRLQRQRPENMSAYSLVFQAMPKCWELNRSTCADAITLLERAVELDSGYALAHALLSWCYGQWVVYNWTEQSDKHRGDALARARCAASLDNTDPLVLTILASAECTAGDIPAAKAHIQRALEIDPNSAWGWIRSGYINAYQGNAQVALDDFQRALRLSPLDPMRCNVLLGMALAHFVDAEYTQAVDYFERSLIENPDAQWVHRGLAAAAAMADDSAKASRSVDIVREYAPWIRLDDIVEAVPYRDDQVRSRFRQGLQRAGFDQ